MNMLNLSGDMVADDSGFVKGVFVRNVGVGANGDSPKTWSTETVDLLMDRSDLSIHRWCCNVKCRGRPPCLPFVLIVRIAE